MTESPRFRPNVPELHRPYAADESRYQQFEYRQVGSSGLYLPPISLGLWWNFGDNIPLDNQRALLRHAFDRGITHFDLANNYGPPTAPPRRTSVASSARTSAPIATS